MTINEAISGWDGRAVATSPTCCLVDFGNSAMKFFYLTSDGRARCVPWQSSDQHSTHPHKQAALMAARDGCANIDDVAAVLGVNVPMADDL